VICSTKDSHMAKPAFKDDVWIGCLTPTVLGN
jgi:hypothetical protein